MLTYAFVLVVNCMIYSIISPKIWKEKKSMWKFCGGWVGLMLVAWSVEGALFSAFSNSKDIDEYNIAATVLFIASGFHAITIFWFSMKYNASTFGTTERIADNRNRNITILSVGSSRKYPGVIFWFAYVLGSLVLIVAFIVRTVNLQVSLYLIVFTIVNTG